MNVTILTAGSRGDVQPFVALGKGLNAVGHTVRLCTSTRFEAMVREHGLDYAPMDDSLLQLGETPAGRAAIEGGGNPLGLLRQVRPLLRRMLEDEWRAAPGSDVILSHPKALGGSHIAEKLGIPGVLSVPLPLYTPTRAFPIPILPQGNLGGWLNRQSYGLVRLIAAPYSGVVNRWRQETLRLPALSRLADPLVQPDGRPVPVLYGFSEHIVPRPADWPPHAVATGYWFLEREDAWQPPPDLLAFLEAGPPPVYVGFGSMAGRDPARLTRIVLDALAESQQRGLLATGWGGLVKEDLPATVFAIEAAPHDWLFEHVSAVVHHGGAGTTAAGLRAGRPTVICPFMGDQHFWGRRVWELGVGPQPIPQKRLSVSALTGAIRLAAGDDTMRQRAAALGAKLRAEDGVARAVEWLQDSLLLQ